MFDPSIVEESHVTKAFAIGTVLFGVSYCRTMFLKAEHRLDGERLVCYRAFEHTISLYILGLSIALGATLPK